MRSRFITLVLFGVFALLALADVFGNLQTLAAPQAMAAQLNISVAEQTTRSSILLILSVVIAVSSMATVVGVWQRSRLAYAWVLVVAGYVLYGVYQIASALLQQTPGVAAGGVVFLALAAAAFSFGRQASRR